MATHREPTTGVRRSRREGVGSFGYRLLYRLGITPWDHDQVPPELVELVEGPAALRPGGALDLGCGTGAEAIYLAQHGWGVTGIDFVGPALEAARREAAAAGRRPNRVLPASPLAWSGSVRAVAASPARHYPVCSRRARCAMRGHAQQPLFQRPARAGLEGVRRALNHGSSAPRTRVTSTPGAWATRLPTGSCRGGYPSRSAGRAHPRTRVTRRLMLRLSRFDLCTPQADERVLASFWQVGREITLPKWVDRAAPDGPARGQTWRNY